MQGANYRFGDIFCRYDIDLEPVLLNGFFCGWADRGYVQVEQLCLAQAKFYYSLPHRFHAIHAGEDEPVIVTKILQSAIKGSVRTGRANFDKGDFNHLGTLLTQPGGESAGLMTSASDENAETCQWPVAAWL